VSDVRAKFQQMQMQNNAPPVQKSWNKVHTANTLSHPAYLLTYKYSFVYSITVCGKLVIKSKARSCAVCAVPLDGPHAVHSPRYVVLVLVHPSLKTVF
jgi:hypothetical protein